jgi:hypothetical protein
MQQISFMALSKEQSFCGHACAGLTCSLNYSNIVSGSTVRLFLSGGSYIICFLQIAVGMPG